MMQPSRPKPVKVLYLLGIYRSGTTLLSNILGQCDGFFCGGELMALWKNLLDPDAVCGCGDPLLACGLWKEVLNTVTSGLGGPTPVATGMVQLQSTIYGNLHTWARLPQLLWLDKAGSARRDAVSRYATSLNTLYRTIGEVTGADVIVDPSKEAANAALLRYLPEVEPYYVHVVRDPRGTVYSSLRDATGGEEVDGARSSRSAYTALSWAFGNVAAGMLRKSVAPDRQIRIRYEDLVGQPRTVLRSLSTFVGNRAEPPLLDERTVVLGTTHTVAGNPNRFRRGPTPLEHDTAWQKHLHPADQKIVASICAPLMLAYGYWRPSSPSTAAESVR